MQILKGICQCGCGQKTRVATGTNSEKGWIKGQPLRYINRHNRKTWHGKNHPSWIKGEVKFEDNYKRIWVEHHPRAINHYIFEHILIAEKALGKFLPDKATVHHHSPIQLVICQSQSYHLLLHQRTRALKVCGHANWRKCPFCKKYDNPANMLKNRRTFYHSVCKSIYRINQKEKKHE